MRWCVCLGAKRILTFFLGTDIYVNDAFREPSAFAVCFTDLAYFQLARAFQVHHAKKARSQLPIPNDSLVVLYDTMAPLFQAESFIIQWSLGRHWNNTGNSLEVLLFFLMEEGYHVLFWQACCVILMHQFRNSGYSGSALVGSRGAVG